MPRFIVRVSALVALLSGCVQPPAQVDLKGQHTFGRNGASYADARSRTAYTPPSYNYSYRSSPAPSVSPSTERTATVRLIGISDLPPPEKPRARAWDSSSAAKREKPVAQLDQAIGNAKATPSKDHGKPVRLTSAREGGFIWPVTSRKVISAFGPKSGGKANDGINIAVAEGEPVWAAADGEVVYADNELTGYGNMLLIKHEGGKTTTYAHLARATVDKYDRVKQGDIIGYTGATGNVSRPQLHFAVRDGKDPVNPRKYLTSSLAGL